MCEPRSKQVRRAGALVPLFSIPSRVSWGIGEITDLPKFAPWLSAAGLSVLQLLPVNEMADGQSSPYSALSAMAIDPVYISLSEIPEFVDAGGEAALIDADRSLLAEARSSPRVLYGAVRELKSRALRRAFDEVIRTDRPRNSAQAAGLRQFMAREAWWLDDYALFRALHHEHGGCCWLDWEPGVRDRTPAALDEARRRLHVEILYRAWLQWMADIQWRRARHACPDIGLCGDFPFVVGTDSADVWVRQREFRLDAAAGVPPDAFSPTGQDWGLPVYKWDEVAKSDHEWLRQRTRRCADLYDGFRVDHLVGFYRTFFRERSGSSGFVPPDEPSQIAQGERLLRLFVESGARIIAEDLGVVPDFVRDSLARTGVPGLKVLRWERDWNLPDHPFRDPSAYPHLSVAITGTHDTETLAEWWDAATPGERSAAIVLPSLRARGCQAASPFAGPVHEGLLDAVFGAGSDLALLPMQDIFGWTDRINTPALVDDVNWTWRPPWPVDTLMSEPQAVERAAWLKELARRHGREIALQRAGGLEL